MSVICGLTRAEQKEDSLPWPVGNISIASEDAVKLLCHKGTLLTRNVQLGILQESQDLFFKPLQLLLHTDGINMSLWGQCISLWKTVSPTEIGHMQSVFGKKLFWKRFLFQCDQALLTNSCLILRHCIENSRFTGHESVCLSKCYTKLQILFASTHNGNYSTYLCSERKISMRESFHFYCYCSRWIYDQAKESWNC